LSWKIRWAVRSRSPISTATENRISSSSSYNICGYVSNLLYGNGVSAVVIACASYYLLEKPMMQWGIDWPEVSIPALSQAPLELNAALLYGLVATMRANRQAVLQEGWTETRVPLARAGEASELAAS
jgi:peptidoglycan/LPS O-acetylase OafA/YrhL